MGYARVSTYEQSLDLQMDSLDRAGCDRIFSDTVSGVRVARPGLERLRDVIRAGDTLVIWRLDRLGRSLADLISWAGWLEQKSVNLLSLHEHLDTASPTGRFVFHVMGALAEFERNLVRERTRAGLVAARTRGRLGGRPAKLGSTQIAQLKAMHRDHGISIGEICTTLGIGRTTLYRYLKRA